MVHTHRLAVRNATRGVTLALKKLPHSFCCTVSVNCGAHATSRLADLRERDETFRRRRAALKHQTWRPLGHLHFRQLQHCRGTNTVIQPIAALARLVVVDDSHEPVVAGRHF